MYQLFEHQVIGINFLRKAKKGLLCDVPGLGKTYQAILAAAREPGNKVVVCPASLKENWAREIIAAGQTDTIKIVDGGKSYTYYEGDTGTEWLVINYDVLDRHLPSLEGYSIGIYDEAHYIKSKTTKRTKAALELAKRLQVLYLLTGTPILNRPEELFTLLEAIGHPLGKNWHSYVYRYCAAEKITFYKKVLDARGRIMYDAYGKPLTRKYQFLKTTGASNLPELADRIKDSYLRRTKDELGDRLPAKIVDTVEVELAPEYRKRYSQAWDTYIEYLENDPDGINHKKMQNVQMTRHLIELGKLKQIASQGKLDRVVEDVEAIVEQGEKVLIFTQYTETVRLLKEKLKAKKIKTVSLTGSDDMRARTKAVDDIQLGDTPVFIGNIKAAGVGLTLTAANTVLMADMEWTPALNEQAEDRAHRIGQHKQVNVHYYIAKDTVDEDIADLLEVKRKIIAEILSGQGGNNKDITAAMIKRMVEKSHKQVMH